ncbi:NUMOD4 domain-containing protein [Robbsia andropogonis]|uniref:NUMOD4 domain-containing protein n=1 Tax=Robbsia andropogonis TaxID=28092 RepID=UPI003D1D2AA9
MDEAENWRAVVGYEGFYEVSDLGRVRSIDRVVSTFSARAGRIALLRRRGVILRQSLNRSGYLTVSLSKGGVAATTPIAKLVCESFYGARSSSLQACHNDGVRTNNRLLNLRWDTPVSNQADRVSHGTDLRGEDVSTAKLTEQQVIRIKRGMTLTEAEREFGISRTQFYRIKRGEAWAHVNAGRYEELARQYA